MTRASSEVNPTVDRVNPRLYNGGMRENARIIVEGLDGSGKTTLVNSLLELSGFPKFERVRNEKGSHPDLDHWWMYQLDKKDEGIPLHDRFFYPELVYGPVLRGGIGTDPGITDYVHRHLRSFSFLIYCRPPDARIRMALSENREQWPGVRENFTTLLARYDEVMDDEAGVYGPRFFVYDYTKIYSQVAILSALEDYIAP